MRAPRLAADAQKRQELHARVRQAERAREVEEGSARRRGSHAGAMLDDGERRRQPDRGERARCRGDGGERALAAHRVVLVGAHAVEADAQVERVARAVEGAARARRGRRVDEDAVGEHGERPARERVVDSGQNSGCSIGSPPVK